MDTLDEAKFQRVIRKGKVKRKLFCPDGFKAQDNVCQKMSPSERMKRKRATKRAARKKKGAILAKMLKKRAKSMKRRAMQIPQQASSPGGQVFDNKIVNRLDMYLHEDARGKVKVGKVTLDTANDFQRQILNQSYLSMKGMQAGFAVYKAMGAKTKHGSRPVSEEDIQKIYNESKKYWNDGGKYIDVNGKKVKLELNFKSHGAWGRGEGWAYYGAYSWGGWVGSTKEYKNPDQAMKEIEKRLEKVVKERGSLRGEEEPAWGRKER
jgi:hypothetical protein